MFDIDSWARVLLSHASIGVARKYPSGEPEAFANICNSRKPWMNAHAGSTEEVEN
jgi:hypothetical protein